jgi:ATP-dependent Clp protease ATP-binding subunit ClpA
LIQKEIENVIARKILGGELVQGQTVVVDFQGDSLIFLTAAAAAEAPAR